MHDTLSCEEVEGLRKDADDLRKNSYISYFWLVGILIAVLGFVLVQSVAWGFAELRDQKSKDIQQDARIEQLAVGLAEQNKDIFYIKQGIDALLSRNP